VTFSEPNRRCADCSDAMPIDCWSRPGHAPEGAEPGRRVGLALPRRLACKVVWQFAHSQIPVRGIEAPSHIVHANNLPAAGIFASALVMNRFARKCTAKEITMLRQAAGPRSTWNLQPSVTCPPFILKRRPGVPNAGNSPCSVVTIN
jgi:hypothetical protein